MTYRTDEQMLAEQKASGHFVDGECLKCHAKFNINTRYPQTMCTSIVDHKYCMGEIEQKQPLASALTA